MMSRFPLSLGAQDNQLEGAHEQQRMNCDVVDHGQDQEEVNAPGFVGFPDEHQISGQNTDQGVHHQRIIGHEIGEGDREANETHHLKLRLFQIPFNGRKDLPQVCGIDQRSVQVEERSNNDSEDASAPFSAGRAPVKLGDNMFTAVVAVDLSIFVFDEEASEFLKCAFHDDTPVL